MYKGGLAISGHSSNQRVVFVVTAYTFNGDAIERKVPRDLCPKEVSFSHTS